MNFDVVAIDMLASGYSQSRVFPVIDYDGVSIPLPDSSVDIVYSSNVLEHVENLPAIFSEFRRVLKPGGYCVHLMPSVVWRFWTFVTGVPTSIVAASIVFRDLFHPPEGASRMKSLLMNTKTMLGALLPIGHGVSKEGVSELWTFSTVSWKKRFRKHGFEIRSVRPIELFHTGHMVLGSRLSIPTRKWLASKLGSAANVYIVYPQS